MPKQTLLEYAKSFTVKKTGQETSQWTQYKEPYYIFLEHGLRKIAAVREIAKFEGLTKKETERLYNSTKQWDRIKKKNNMKNLKS